MASLKEIKTTNKVLFETIRELVKYSNKTGIKLYRAVAEQLNASASHRAEVNLSHIERVCKEGETIIIPGKVLGTGNLTKKLKIIAFNISESAKKKIEKSGSEFLTIKEFLSKKPKEKPRIIA